MAARKTSQKLKVTPNLLKRLGLEAELEGHEGCVNCLEWNENGKLVILLLITHTKVAMILSVLLIFCLFCSILASASDDMKVILWDPFRKKKKLTLQTGHGGNIFTVKVKSIIIYLYL